MRSFVFLQRAEHHNDERMMSAEEKALLQAKHRLEEAQARDRAKERKQRTRRLIQEGAILERVLPEVTGIALSELDAYLERRLREDA